MTGAFPPRSSWNAFLSSFAGFSGNNEQWAQEQDAFGQCCPALPAFPVSAVPVIPPIPPALLAEFSFAFRQFICGGFEYLQNPGQWPDLAALAQFWHDGSSIISGHKFLKPFDQLAHAEWTVNGWSLYRGFAYPDYCAQSLFLKTQADFFSSLHEVHPMTSRFWWCHGRVPGQSSARIFRQWPFQTLDSLWRRLRLMVCNSLGNVAFLGYDIRRIFQRFPALHFSIMAPDFMRLPDVKTVIGAHNFQGFGMHTIDRYVDMIISGVVVQPVNCLMSLKSHFPRENSTSSSNLLWCRLFSLWPWEYVMVDRHLAAHGLSGKANHLHLLRHMRVG